ncbi:MAG: hypothetical protein ACPGYV_11475, partial [Phycisphaeraceae bacterium]
YGDHRFVLATPKDEPIQAELSPEAFAYLMSMLTGRPDEPALTIAAPMPVFLTIRDEQRAGVSIVTRTDKVGLKQF